MKQIAKQTEVHQSSQLQPTQSSEFRKSKSENALISKQENNEENYNFSVLYFAFFAIYVGRTLILPLLPSYGNAIWTETHPDDEAKKLPDDKQGLLAALFYLAYATSGILFGPLSIRIGRKPVILLCIIGITVGFIFQSLAFDYWSLVSARTFSGFFAAVDGITQSYITDICKPEHVPKYTARLGTVFGLVWGLGPLFAAIVSSLNDSMLKHVFDDEVESHKYRLSLAFAACSTGIASIFVCFKLKESLPDNLRVKWRQNESKESIEDGGGESTACARIHDEMFANEQTTKFKARLRNYMLFVLVVTVLMDIATAGHATIFALLNNGKNIEEGLEWGDFMFGLAWMTYGISFSIIQLFYVRLQIRFGAFGTGAIGAGIKTIGCVAIPLLTSMCKHKLCLDADHASTQWIEFAMHIPASILNGVGYGLSNTATSTIISDYSKRYDVRSVGHWLGAWMGCVALGAAGVMVLGNVSHHIGALNTFYVCAGCSSFSMIIYLALSYFARDIPIKVDKGVKKGVEGNDKKSNSNGDSGEIDAGVRSLDGQLQVKHFRCYSLTPKFRAMKTPSLNFEDVAHCKSI